MGQLSPCATTVKPSLHALEPVPTAREQPPLTATRESPRAATDSTDQKLETHTHKNKGSGARGQLYLGEEKDGGKTRSQSNPQGRGFPPETRSLLSVKGEAFLDFVPQTALHD